MSPRAALAALGLLAAVAAGSCHKGFVTTGKKLVVIGIDGMDPILLRQYMGEGAMPNFKALADEGTFVPLGTSEPPQSPVAWSTFITGMDPGGHGVFDFLHRDPRTYAPVSSTVKAATDPPLTIPISPSKQIELPPAADPVRQGVPFWDVLAQQGVRAAVYKIPAAYPIQKSRQLTLADMGVPDLQGGIDGTYAYYTTDIPDNSDRIDGNGGFWHQVSLLNGRAFTWLTGPPSPYLRPKEGSAVAPLTRSKLTIYVDPKDPVVQVEIEDGGSCTLREGEWSQWIPCSFDLGLPFQSMSGMVKFFLQHTRPELRLYCSPVNIDPSAPCMPISTPNDDAVEDMCESIGRFYTAGLAEETKGLQMGTIDDAEFVQQCDDVTRERMDLLRYALDHFDDGLLFFYFSTIDLRCHMMWRHLDPKHPMYDPKLAARFRRSIEDAYVEMDHALGEIRERIGRDTPIIVLSDHGFSTFEREVDVNRWLLEQGYLVLEPGAQAAYEEAVKSNPHARVPVSLVEHGGIDRARTRAYAVGFNGIYLNQKGREAGGIVEPADRARLLDEIRSKLLAIRDDDAHDRTQVVRKVSLSEEIYHGSEKGNAPDLVVGYNRGYGACDDSALGLLTLRADGAVVRDNKSLWSGNHLMAPEVVPGVFLTNRKLDPKDPCLYDVTTTMIRFFGVAPPAEMRGRDLF